MICNTYKMFFGTLSDETKLDILQKLRREPCNVTELCRTLKKKQSTISHSLSKLKEHGFVTHRVDGKQRIYAVDPNVDDLLKRIDAHVNTYYEHYCKCVGCTCAGETEKNRRSKCQ